MTRSQNGCEVQVRRLLSLKRAGMRLGAGLLVTQLAGLSVFAQEINWGGSLRLYSFFRTENAPVPFPQPRRDSEFFSLRLQMETAFDQRVSVETHLVLDFLSPFESGSQSLATGASSPYLPLQRDLAPGADDYSLQGRFDRLNLQLEFDSARVVVGRQAISWGVSHFWPALDLFSSFAPQRIDREYKEGVDAIRIEIPLGQYSELQVIGASLGPALRDDGAVGALARIHLGSLDLGLMAGRFHGDKVGGFFLTTDYQGSAVRLEFAYTDSGDPADRSISRDNFWRGSVGLDRQLHPDLNLSVELAYNGFGASGSEEYLRIAESDRVRRGEVNALGRYYAGVSLTWQLHPLWTLNNAALLNWQDPSLLWIPVLQWSSSDNTSLLFALQTGFGSGLSPNLQIESEYGLASTTLFAAFKWYW